MAMNFVPLDKATHKSTKVATQLNFMFAKTAHISAATINEFAQLASAMPLFLIKNPSDSYSAIAMLGFEQEQNLFLLGERWEAAHVPMNIQRYPFDIRPNGDKLGVYIDENSDLVGDVDGEPLFVGEEPSEYLKSRQQFLANLANSEMMTKTFIDKLVALDLVEEVQILLQYKDGAKRNVTGVFGINERKLLDLNAEQVADFHKNGLLGAAYAMMLSAGQLSRLVELSNQTANPVAAVQIYRPQTQAAESQPA